MNLHVSREITSSKTSSDTERRAIGAWPKNAGTDLQTRQSNTNFLPGSFIHNHQQLEIGKLPLISASLGVHCPSGRSARLASWAQGRSGRLSESPGLRVSRRQCADIDRLPVLGQFTGTAGEQNGLRAVSDVVVRARARSQARLFSGRDRCPKRESLQGSAGSLVAHTSPLSRFSGSARCNANLPRPFSSRHLVSLAPTCALSKACEQTLAKSGFGECASL